MKFMVLLALVTWVVLPLALGYQVTMAGWFFYLFAGAVLFALAWRGRKGTLAARVWKHFAVFHGGLAIVGLFLAFALARAIGEGIEEDMRLLEQETRRIVLELHVEQGESGAYPETLELKTATASRYGGWTYERTEEGFRLSLGEGPLFYCADRGFAPFE